MHRLSSAWIEPELAEWRHHHAEQGGRHDSISCLLHQQSNSNCYRFFRMSLKYICSSLARAEPTHRCASNAPISPAHARICHKTKASKRNFLLHPLREARGRGGAGPDQLHGSTRSLCILLQECILHHYISPHATRETVSPTPWSTAITSTCRVPL